MTTKKKKSRQTQKAKRFRLQNPWVRTLLGTGFIVACFFLNLLISGDHLDGFALLCGLDILIALIVSWAIFIHRRQKAKKD